MVGICWIKRLDLKKCYFITNWLQNITFTYLKISAVIPAKIFAKVDVNKDGKLTGEEIIQHTFAKMDANQDGEITEAEFVKACLASEEISNLFGLSPEDFTISWEK